MEALNQELARALAFCLRQALERQGRASLAVSPSPSVRDAMVLLADEPMDWPRVEVCLTEQRWVPPGDPQDGEHHLRRALGRGAAVEATVRGLRANDARPVTALPELVERLRTWALPFDVLVLAVRADGGLAGLYPDMPGLPAMLDVRWPVPVGVFDQDEEGRGVTLSLRHLVEARDIFLVIEDAGTLEAQGGRNPQRPLDALLRRTRAPVRLLRAGLASP